MKLFREILSLPVHFIGVMIIFLGFAISSIAVFIQGYDIKAKRK